MNRKGLFPPSSSEEANKLTATKEIMFCLQKLGHWTAKQWNRKPNCDLDLVTQLFHAWKDFYVVNTQEFNEIQTYTMGEDRVRFVIGSHIFVELSRLYLIMQAMSVARDDTLTLKDMEHVVWTSLSETFDITKQPKEKDEVDDEDALETFAHIQRLWERPIATFSQRDVILIVMFLTQQLNEVTEAYHREYRGVFQAVWERASFLLMEPQTEAVLDDPAMRLLFQEGVYVFHRDFAVFLTFYLGAIMRRFHYVDMVHSWTDGVYYPSPASTIAKDRVKRWICEHMIERNMSDEIFSDAYGLICMQSYAFSGDDRWIRYSNPQAGFMSRAEILAKLRPHLCKRFDSETEAQKRFVLASDSHSTRLLLLHAVSTYIQTQTGITNIRWDKRIAVHSEEISRCSQAILLNESPFLIQFLSSYWVYYGRKVFITDDLYEAIYIWFLWLRDFCQGKLHEFDLSAFITEAIGNDDRGAAANAFYI